MPKGLRGPFLSVGLIVSILAYWLPKCIPLNFSKSKASSSDTEAPFLELQIPISNATVASKFYDTCDGFYFDIVNCPFEIATAHAFPPDIAHTSLSSLVLLEYHLMSMLLTKN